MGTSCESDNQDDSIEQNISLKFNSDIRNECLDRTFSYPCSSDREYSHDFPSLESKSSYYPSTKSVATSSTYSLIHSSQNDLLLSSSTTCLPLSSEDSSSHSHSIASLPEDKSTYSL